MILRGLARVGGAGQGLSSRDLLILLNKLTTSGKRIKGLLTTASAIVVSKTAPSPDPFMNKRFSSASLIRAIRISKTDSSL